jgi:hypothetical protein
MGSAVYTPCPISAFATQMFVSPVAEIDSHIFGENEGDASA